MQKNKKIIIGVVVCLVVALLSFRGGMMYSNKGTIPNNAIGQGSFNQGGFNQNGVGGRTGQGMRGGAGSGAVSGEILSKDATSMTIKLRDGGSKIVLLSPTMKIEKTVDGTIADVVIGKSVMVTGGTNPDGSVNASSIQLRPAFITPAKTN